MWVLVRSTRLSMIGPVDDEDYSEHVNKTFITYERSEAARQVVHPHLIKTKELIFKFVCLYIPGSMSSACRKNEGKEAKRTRQSCLPGFER